MNHRELSDKTLELTRRALGVHYKQYPDCARQRVIEMKLGSYINILYGHRRLLEEFCVDIEQHLLDLEKLIAEAEQTEGCVFRPKSPSLEDRTADLVIRVLILKERLYKGHGGWYSLFFDLGGLLEIANEHYFPNPDTLPVDHREDFYEKFLKRAENLETEPWTNRHLGKTTNFARNLNFDR